MSTGIVVAHPWLSGAVAVVPTAVALTPAAGRAQFQVLVGLKYGLDNVKADPPLVSYAVDQLRAQLGTSGTGLSADAQSKLVTAIAVEQKRRKDQATARKALTEAVEKLLKDFEKDYPSEALAVWKLYLDWIKKEQKAATEVAADIKKTEARIKKLQAAARSRP